MTERDEDRSRQIELGDEVIYRGLRWMLDDEALIGLEGQPDIVFNQLDQVEAFSILDALRPVPPVG
ncbi:MAG: hypothetical protein M3Q23_01485 [Actinomycetota bacterium]|nr:hypothetical protein [Actinomycetota bacterium]